VTRAALAAALLLAAGCIPGEGPMMSPGEDCLECHGGGEGGGGGGDKPNAIFGLGGGEDDGPPWTVAGTVYGARNAAASDGVRGARIHLTESNGSGRTVSLRSNEAGNFYLADHLTFPLRVAVEKDGLSRTMPDAVNEGGCNGCHSAGGNDGAEGRVSYR
jgi:hypothetical protein